MTHKCLFFGFFVLSSIFLAAHDVDAQRKAISSSEYYSGIYPKPAVPWSERSRRVEDIEETINDGVVTKSNTTVSEFLLPDRRRYYTKKVEDGKVTEFERITIEHWEYTRENGGAWTKVDLRGRAGGTGYGSGSGSGGTACTQFSVESVIINGISAKLFEALWVTSIGQELSFHESRRWIGDDGLPYREEEVKGMVHPRIETFRDSTTYDYNPNIKIEAPIN